MYFVSPWLDFVRDDGRRTKDQGLGLTYLRAMWLHGDGISDGYLLTKPLRGNKACFRRDYLLQVVEYCKRVAKLVYIVNNIALYKRPKIIVLTARLFNLLCTDSG